MKGLVTVLGWALGLERGLAWALGQVVALELVLAEEVARERAPEWVHRHAGREALHNRGH